jgi:hypothetical protein
MLASLPLFFIGIALFFAIVLFAIRLWRSDFGYSWLITAFGALIVWTLILGSRINIPQTIALSIWSIPEISSAGAVLMLDHISWPYAFAVGTLLVGVVLTDIARAQESDWSAWTASLIFTALGLLAVLAGNLLTLILAWAAIDFAELLVMFWHVRSNGGKRSVALAFSGKVISLFMLLWAWILAGQFGSDSTFDSIPEQSGLFLLLAAWIRVGVVPLNMPEMQEQPVQRGLGTLVRLISAAAGLVLVARTSQIGVVGIQETYLIGLAGILCLYGGITWQNSRDITKGHAYWIIGISAMAMASAIRGEEAATMAWSLTGLLSGGLLFLYSIQRRFLGILPALGLLQASSLPFTQTWNGVALYGSLQLVFSFLFLIGYALLLAGYFLSWWNSSITTDEEEQWILIIYVWGLAFIPLAQLLLAWFENFTEGAWVTPIEIATILPAIAVCVGATLIIILQTRGLSIPVPGRRIIGAIFSLDWFYRTIGKAFDLLGRGVALVTLVLEGEGGILWALLWLILLFALVAQGAISGI